jgi:hypothetical protein
MAGSKWEKKPDWPFTVKYWGLLLARVGLNGSRVIAFTKFAGMRIPVPGAALPTAANRLGLG